MAKGSTGSFSALLSPGLVKEHSVKSMPVRKGDTVIIKQGIFKDIEGKITRVDRDKSLIYVEGVTREKSDGNTKFLPIHSSKVVITKLDLDDDRRKAILERKAFKPSAEAMEKPKIKTRSRSTARRTRRAKKSEDVGEKENKDDA